ncbi:eukaryotic translation initiation factor 2 alpha subunit-domain-containing protein [Umbelopsis sp. AD052]|nr:eukaryotic translation initiation factor 2 alpha subunit-domain-containing protein [Umbelopsis sp. AD052]
MATDTLNCRMYEKEFPEVDDLVMVNVRQIADMGAYVKLLEYNDREGMILLSELSRRRIRSVQKLIRVNRNEVVVVLRVDEEKGYIDLSKRRVSPEEISKCEEKYNKSKAVHSILRHVAEKHHIALKELYETIGWPLYKKYGHAFDAFKMAIIQPEEVFEGIQMTPQVRDELVGNIKRRMTPQPVKIRAQLDLRCTGIDGVNAIKAALTAGEAVSTEEVPIKVTYLAAPLYVVTADALDKQLGFEVMEKAIQVMKETLEEFKWSRFKVEKDAQLVSENDDRDFAALMAKAEKENELVSGDEDEGDAVAAASDDDM